jgi:formylglycine-generating enzyme required for sulfatase activity/predicted Ser/Thr protein kinase
MTSDRRERIEAVALEALARGEGERAAYLAAACAGDAELRREVESLVAGQGAAADLLESPPWRSPYDQLPYSLAVGRVVGGRYEIAQELGRGGMAVVYKAKDLQLRRWVALKFLPPGLAAFDGMRDRFLVEARAAAALSHPNICVIHEVGEDAGQLFIAMEYVDGETLLRRIKREALDIDEAVALISQIAAGLEAAHRRGIVHRDIKSSNIMVTGQGQATIMDFGLAKLQGGPALTKSGTTLGTVAYMSPEQASGFEVDHRSDLWSAGVVLYEMLAGELPFQGDRDVAIVHAILHEEPRPMRSRTPPVPPALEHIVAKALKKKPEDRYGSAGAMLSDLHAYEATRRAEAAGMFSARALARQLRRPRVAFVVAAATLILAVAAAWFVQHRARVRWARQVALPEIERLIGENDYWRNLVPPYRLAVEAEAVLEEDPKLAELFSKVALKIDIRTEPPGARVYMKEYETPDAEWTCLGVTPLEKIRVPVGIFRWKFEKTGYETVLAAASTWTRGTTYQRGMRSLDPSHLVRTLDKAGSLPAGMVRVPATDTPVGRLGDFFIGRYEVTNREYRAFVETGGYRSRAFWKHRFTSAGRELTWDEAMKVFVDRSGQPGPATWLGGDYPEEQADYPVSGVSWYEAAAYAEYAGKSLPTSAHWDVARGGSTPMIRFPQSGGFALLAPFSNFGGNGPVRVGSLQNVTAYGTYDMPGNVREWCWNETPVGRVIRGGAWEDNTYEFGEERHAPAIDRSPRNGFRLARYPDGAGATEAAFAAVRPVELPDARAERPVSDEIFKVYKEQLFAYDKTDLHAKVESRKTNPGGWALEKVSFGAAYGGERVTAYLFLPSTSRPPFQTVTYFPGVAARRIPSSEDIETYYEFPMFLSFLVKSGRAVVFPVYKGTFERSILPLVWPAQETRANAELQGQAVKDFRRCLDYLETRTEIDSRKLAFYGMSWGGDLGGIIPAVEDRLAASVLLAGGLLRERRPETQSINYVTRIMVPTLMLNGKYDTIIDSHIRPMFDLLGTPPEHKRLIEYDTDHIPPRQEYIKETLAWLDKYLGPVRR